MGRLVLAAVAFALVAPRGLVLLPVAALGLARGSVTTWRAILTGIAAGLALEWMLRTGEPPDQTVRALALFAAVAYVALSDRTRLSVTHRALLAAGLAAAGTVVLYVVLGRTWHQMHWWVESRTAFALQFVGMVVPWDTLSAETQAEFAAAMARWARWTADTFPAMTLIQLVAGLGLATALHARLAARPRGQPAGALRDFRFSEHLGWLLVLGVAGLLFAPAGTPFRLAALNLVTLGGALYLARGYAVTAFFWARSGAARWVAVAGIVALVLLMPVAIGALLALGVLDAGLDLRRRAAPPRNP